VEEILRKGEIEGKEERDREIQHRETKRVIEMN
jgi:hypothetical protein